jgi:hypothetical protein
LGGYFAIRQARAAIHAAVVTQAAIWAACSTVLRMLTAGP